MFTPAIAALIVMLIVTRDGYPKGGWKTLGLHRLNIGAWWIAVATAWSTYKYLERGRGQSTQELGTEAEEAEART